MIVEIILISPLTISLSLPVASVRLIITGEVDINI